jgi:hypothetical protein
MERNQSKVRIVMPNLNPNSTDYVHSHEPNTSDLITAMDYNASGQPVIRVASATDLQMPTSFASFDNYDDKGSNRGWEFQDDWIPLFGLRVKPDSGAEFHLLDFSITLNGGNQVVAGYRWHMNPTLGSAYSWTDLNSSIQYVKFDDIDGTPNEITSYPSTMVHSRALVGKSTADLTPEMKLFPFTDGGIEMFLEVRRLDGGATQDLFYHLTMGID